MIAHIGDVPIDEALPGVLLDERFELGTTVSSPASLSTFASAHSDSPSHRTRFCSPPLPPAIELTRSIVQ